jgi:hypothetical protein
MTRRCNLAEVEGDMAWLAYASLCCRLCESASRGRPWGFIYAAS